jgi:hypothetical protein
MRRIWLSLTGTDGIVTGDHETFLTPMPDYPTCRRRTMSATQDDITATQDDITIVLAEFAALRAEILQTLSQQWLILAFDLTAAGAIFSLALARHNTGLLLVIPVVTYSLVNQYLRNFKMLLRLGKYIQEQLSEKVNGRLGWEEWLRARLVPIGGQNPFQQLLGSLSPLPLIFLGISTVALAWVITYLVSTHNLSTSSRSLLWVLCVLCAILTAMSLISIQRVWKILSDNPEGNAVAQQIPSS